MPSTKPSEADPIAPNAPREIELKLELDRAHVHILKDHSRLKALPSRTVEQRSVYYDTPKEKLREAGYTLRVRQAGRRFVQTVKGDDRRVGGIFHRAEWEQKIEGLRPDLDALSDTPAGGVLDGMEAPYLVPLFLASVERTAWKVTEQASRIEIVLDDGEVIADGKRSPILEMELELLAGEPHSLFAFARELAVSAPLRIGVLSKFERGLMLRDGGFGKPVKAFPAPVALGMTAGDAFQAIATACIRQFRLNEPLFVEARSSGALHQSRVALRRLRSAFSMFGPLASDGQRDGIRDGLRWISQALGEARDLDVFVDKLLDQGQITTDVRTKAVAERDRAFDKAIEALSSQRLRTLMLDLVEWLPLGPWHAADNPAHALRDEPVEHFAREMLDRLRKKVRNRGRRLADLDDEDRHQVRIAAKKLRYGSEFFATLFDGGGRAKLRKSFLAALEDLQTHLGELNDMVTARTLEKRFPGFDPGVHDRAALLAAAEKAHERLVDAGRFWR